MKAFYFEINASNYAYSADFPFNSTLYFQSTMEKAMAPDSSTLAWKIPWTEEP